MKDIALGESIFELPEVSTNVAQTAGDRKVLSETWFGRPEAGGNKGSGCGCKQRKVPADVGLTGRRQASSLQTQRYVVAACRCDDGDAMGIMKRGLSRS